MQVGGQGLMLVWYSFVPVTSGTGAPGITPTIGGNGNWFSGATDTGVKAQGTNGTIGINGVPGIPGTSVSVNVCFFKSGINGIVPLTEFSWITNLIVSRVILLGFATNISATINGNTYTKDTLIGAHLDTPIKMTNIDISISAGQNSGSVIIIF